MEKQVEHSTMQSQRNRANPNHLSRNNLVSRDSETFSSKCMTRKVIKLKKNTK